MGRGPCHSLRLVGGETTIHFAFGVVCYPFFFSKTVSSINGSFSSFSFDRRHDRYQRAKPPLFLKLRSSAPCANKAAVCSEFCDARKRTLFIAIFYVWFTLGFKGQSVVGLHAGELPSVNNQRPPNYR